MKLKRILLISLFALIFMISMVGTGAVLAKYSKQLNLTGISLNVVASDSSGPALTLSAPPSTNTINYTVTGTVTDESGVKSVKVNGVDAAIAGNTWSADISLTGTTVTAVATDTAGNESVQTITYQEFTVDESNRSLVGYDENGVDTDLVMLATFFDEEDKVFYKVTSIANYAFYDSNLTSLVLPNSITSLGEGAFQESYNLKELFVPASIQTFGQCTFDCCMSLSSVTLEEGLETIGDNMFSGTGFKTISIPDSVQMIDWDAFINCALERIIIPNNVEYIGGWAFKDCYSLKEVVIGNGVKIIDDQAFSGCSSLTEITFEHTKNDPIEITTGAFYVASYKETTITSGNSSVYQYDWVADNRALVAGLYETGTTTLLKSWDDMVTDGDVYVSDGTVRAGDFHEDHALIKNTGDLVLPNGVTRIGVNGFTDSNITGITIPNSVTSIGDGAFSYCVYLTSVNIPDSVITMEDNTFDQSALQSITIGSGLTNIGSGSFEYCNSLTNITVNPNNPYYHNDGNCLIETESKKLVAIGINSVIPADGSVTTIDEWVFEGRRLSSITIPASVTKIMGGAFFDCNLGTAIFETTTGWTAGTTPVDVSDPATAATLLINTYVWDNWTRN